MPETQKGQILAAETEKIINRQLIHLDKRLRNPEDISYDTLYSMVLEANKLIKMICMDDFDAYESCKYRIFINQEGRVYLTQGQEIDTDYLPDDFRPLDEE